MLINLYNGKPTSDFQEHYATIAQILYNQKQLQQSQTKNSQTEITAEALFELCCQKIEGIVGTVKDKLQEDAKKDGLVVIYKQEVTVQPQPIQPATTEQANTKKRTKQTQMQEILVAKDYRELQPKFDEILSAVGDYFELFKNNTNKLEDLWL